jgi:hypothetical protein
MRQSRRKKAIVMLAHGQSVTEVSDAVGVSRQTIYTWLADEDIQMAIHEEKTRMLTSLTGRLTAVCEKASEHMMHITSGDEDYTLARDVTVRLRADSIALSRLPTLIELADFDKRLTRLEKKVKDGRYRS